MNVIRNINEEQIKPTFSKLSPMDVRASSASICSIYVSMSPSPILDELSSISNE